MWNIQSFSHLKVLRGMISWQGHLKQEKYLFNKNIIPLFICIIFHIFFCSSLGRLIHSVEWTNIPEFKSPHKVLLEPPITLLQYTPLAPAPALSSDKRQLPPASKILFVPPIKFTLESQQTLGSSTKIKMWVETFPKLFSRCQYSTRCDIEWWF